MMDDDGDAASVEIDLSHSVATTFQKQIDTPQRSLRTKKMVHIMKKKDRQRRAALAIVLFAAAVVLALTPFAAAGAPGFNETQACYAALGKPGAARAAAGRFFKEHVVGKRVSEPARSLRVGGGKVESVFSQSIRFGNFTETKWGFSFNADTAISQTLYELGPNGKRLAGPGKKTDRRFIWRYQVTERRSTNQLTGAAFPVDKTGALVDDAEWPFTIYALTVCVPHNETVRIVHSSVPYADLFAQGGGFRPGFEDLIVTYSLDARGKLERQVKMRGYDLDMKTLEKKLSDEAPERVQREDL